MSCPGADVWGVDEDTAIIEAIRRNEEQLAKVIKHLDELLAIAKRNRDEQKAA